MPVLTRRCATALLVIVAVARPAQARPQRVGIVARVAKGAPVEQRALAEAAARVIRATGDEAVVTPVTEAAARRAAGAVPRERLDVLARAQELSDEGWRAYLAVDPSFAEARLVEARRTLEEVLELDGALDLMADVSLRLGAVRMFAKRTADAQAAFALAAALDPEREVGERDFAPEVVKLYERTRGARPAADATLEVVSSAGATIEVDGVPAGASRVKVNVAPGEHVVLARAAGRAALGRIVLVRAPGSVAELPLDEDPVARALGRGEGALAVGVEAPAVATLGALAGTFAELDELLLVGATWRAGAPALLAQRCVPKPTRCSAVIELRFPEAGRLGQAMAALARRLPSPRSGRGLEPILLEDTRLAEPEGAPDRGGRRGGPRAWWKSHWLWVGLGSAAAIVATGVIIVLADEPAVDYHIGVTGFTE